MLAGAPARPSRLLALAAALALAACQKSTAVDFEVVAPTETLLDPFALNVSDYVLKKQDGSILAAVSVGAKASKNGLPLGPLPPALSGTLRLDVLSGLALVGLAYIDGVAIQKGKTEKVQAQVRKPLVVVGSARTAEQPTGSLAAPQLLDPTTSTDLVTAGLSVPAAAAASFTRDGQKLLLASTRDLSIFDTGNGKTTASSALAFTPALITVAPNDKVVAFVEAGTASSRVALYTDVGGLLANGPNAASVTGTIPLGVPRAAHFSPDGATLYVLTETAGSQPCSGTAPATNQIIPISTAGVVGTAIAMPAYVADFAVEPDGTLLLAVSGANELATLSPTGGQVTKLYDAACPTAMRLLGSDVYVVTNDANAEKTSFALLHGHTDGSMASRVAIALPAYATRLTTATSSVAAPTLSFTADNIVGTELAVSPDGSRAVLATRARYTRTKTQTFDVLGLTCEPGLDVVEYGLYSIDLDAGSASYTARSQAVVTSNADAMGDCVSCSKDLGPDGTLLFVLGCDSKAGDRAAGLSAAFSEGP